MRFVAMTLACLTIGVTAIGATAGCSAPATAQAQTCPAGVPWISADYANGKWVPGHCQGQPAQ